MPCIKKPLHQAKNIFDGTEINSPQKKRESFVKKIAKASLFGD